MYVPACEKCLFYIPGRYVHTGTCRKYLAFRGRGKMVYDFTENVRADLKKCGPNGRLFIKKRVMYSPEDDDDDDTEE